MEDWTTNSVVGVVMEIVFGIFCIKGQNLKLIFSLASTLRSGLPLDCG